MNRNPQLQIGVDAEGCPDTVPEVLTVLIRASCGDFIGTLVFDAENVGVRQWLGQVNIAGLTPNGNSQPLTTGIRLVCQRRGWRVVVNGLSEQEPTIEETRPLFLQFADIRLDGRARLGIFEHLEITITE